MANDFQEFTGLLVDVRHPAPGKPLRFTVESDKGNGYVETQDFSAFEKTLKGKPIPAYQAAPQLRGQQVKVAFTVYDNGKYTNYNAWSVEPLSSNGHSQGSDASFTNPAPPATNGGDSNDEIPRWILRLEQQLISHEQRIAALEQRINPEPPTAWSRHPDVGVEGGF